MIHAAALALLLPLPARADEKPDWLSGQSARYPSAQYVIGVGEGPTQEKAADHARAELAKNLSISIEASSQDSASEVTDGRASSFSQNVSDDVKTSTSKVLDGVTIAQYWQGPDQIYALATLDRARSVKVLADKIAELDREFVEQKDRLPRLDDKFSRLRAALKLIGAARDRRKLNEDYRLLSPDGSGIKAPEGAADVVAAARRAISQVAIQVSASGDDGDAVQTRLLDSLSGYGIKAVEKSGQPADIVLEASAQARKLPPENLTWYWARGTISVKLSYGKTGEVFSRFDESGQEAASDPDSSVEAVLAKLSDAVAAHAFKIVTTHDLAED